jgi:DNA-binding CsgD family transcriptional regulator
MEALSKKQNEVIIRTEVAFWAISWDYFAGSRFLHYGEQKGDRMRRNDNHMMAKIKKSLAKMTETIESQPIIFIDPGGRHWLSNAAREFISGKKIVKDDFMDWIKIGSSHLQNFSYGDIDIGMMRLPEEGSIAFLRPAQNGPESRCRLTKKETDVLRHLAKGCSNKKIAESMDISPGTVNSHLDNIYQKLNCSSRSVACLIALRNGLLLPSRKTPDKKT